MHARSPRQTKANNLSASYQGRIVPAAGLFVSPILLPCIHASNEWEMNRTEKSFRRDMALGHKGAPKAHLSIRFMVSVGSCSTVTAAFRSVLFPESYDVLVKPLLVG